MSVRPIPPNVKIHVLTFPAPSDVAVKTDTDLTLTGIHVKVILTGSRTAGWASKFLMCGGHPTYPTAYRTYQIHPTNYLTQLKVLNSSSLTVIPMHISHVCVSLSRSSNNMYSYRNSLCFKLMLAGYVCMYSNSPNLA